MSVGDVWVRKVGIVGAGCLGGRLVADVVSIPIRQISGLFLAFGINVDRYRCRLVSTRWHTVGLWPDHAMETRRGSQGSLASDLRTLDGQKGVALRQAACERVP